MSSHSSSRSPVEESFFSTQEDHISDAQSVEASSTVMVTPNESSKSVYATANQTPMASPDLNRDTAPSTPEKVKDAPGKLRLSQGLSAEPWIAGRGLQMFQSSWPFSLTLSKQ